MTPAIRFRVMPASVVAHPAFGTLAPAVRCLAYELHVGPLCQTTIGIYRVGLVELAHLAGEPEPMVAERLGELERRGFVAFDAEHGVMRLPAWLADYRPSTVKSFKAGLGWIARIPECRARDIHLGQLRLQSLVWGEKFAAAFEGFAGALASASGDAGVQLVMPLPLVDVAGARL